MYKGNKKTEKTEKKKVYPVLEMEEKGSLILPDHIITQINYLHGKVGKEEWSGMLFYDVKSGSPAKPEEFVLVAKQIFLMDIGSAAYTEYETDEDIVDIYTEYDEAMDWKTGHVHTHHDMGAYFSNTDDSELNDNVDKHNYYLSLIVAFNGRYEAKVAFLSDVSTTSHMSYTDDAGKLKKFDTGKEEKHMVTIDMNIFYEYSDSFFYDRYDKVTKKIADKAEVKKKSLANKYKGKNDSFYDPLEHSLAPKVIPFEGDPKDMKTVHVEKLARNVFSVTPELSELRSVYQILHLLADNEPGAKAIYYSMLRQNIQLIIENFFDQDLDLDEMTSVIEEVSNSMLRFAAHLKLQDLIAGITEVLVEFLSAYEEDLKDNVITEQSDEEALLELEAENL